MATVTVPAPRVIRSFDRQLPPIRPTRIAPRPEGEFAEGLLAEVDPESSYALSSILPKTCGFGLTGEEHDRVAAARNRTRAAFKSDCPAAPYREVERVAEQAAKDEMRRVLRERPAAVAVEVKVDEQPTPVAAPAKPTGSRFNATKLSPAPVKRPLVRPRLESRPVHTLEDELWWSQITSQAANAPAPISGGSPESVREFSESWNLPSDDQDDDLSFSERCDLLPETEPELSDDFGGAFGTGGAE